MPKRKQKDYDIGEIARKLRKLDKKVRKKKSRHRRRSTTSSSGNDFTPPRPVSNEQEDEPIGDLPIEVVDISTHDPLTVGGPPATATSSEDVLTRLAADDLNDEPGGTELELDEELLEILGTDPTVTEKFAKELHKELANRFEYIAINGLEKETRKELCQKYLVPINCKKVGAPTLNAEIKAALSESVVKRDKGIETRQKQIATAISCLGEALTTQLAARSKNNNTIKSLMDACRILGDIQYHESVTRRNFAAYSVKKEMKEPLMNTKIDLTLFGEDLSEALKTAKAVSKSGTDLKVLPPVNITRKPSDTRPLNWRPPAGARAQRYSGEPAHHPRPTRHRGLPAATGGGRPPPPPPPPPNRGYHSNSSRPPQHLHRTSHK